MFRICNTYVSPAALQALVILLNLFANFSHRETELQTFASAGAIGVRDES